MEQVDYPFFGDNFSFVQVRETESSSFFVEDFQTRKMSSVLICLINNTCFTWATYSEILLAQLINIHFLEGQAF